MMITTPSRPVAARALCLPVEQSPTVSYLWRVGSGSEPGRVYDVYAPTGHGQDDPHNWQCECIAPAGSCSHVWAAMAANDSAVRKALLRTRRGLVPAVMAQGSGRGGAS